MTSTVIGRGFRAALAWAGRERAPSPEMLGDADLLARASGGDEGACRALLERHGPRLAAVVQAAHGDLGLTEDIVQDAFLRALDRAHQLREETSFFPWLARIALRVALDHRQRRRHEVLTETPLAPPQIEGSSPESLALEQEDAVIVQRALAELPPARRELLTLRYYTNLSVAELAHVFDKSEVAIRKDLQRARAELEQRLRGWFESEGR